MAGCLKAIIHRHLDVGFTTAQGQDTAILVHTNYLVVGTLPLRQRTRGIERQHSGLELSREGGVVEGEFGGTQC